MDRPVREKKRTNIYDPAKEAAKPQWKKPKKKTEDKKPKVNRPGHTYWIDISRDEDEPAGSSSGGAAPGSV